MDETPKAKPAEDQPGDRVWRRDEPDSPCQTICLIHPTARLCIGCHRTPEEISHWARYTPEERAGLRAELADRKLPATARSGGRAGRRARRDNSS